MKEHFNLPEVINFKKTENDEKDFHKSLTKQNKKNRKATEWLLLWLNNGIDDYDVDADL